MPEEFKPGCQRPPIKKVNVQTEEIATTELIMKEAKQSMVKVGKPARILPPLPLVKASLSIPVFQSIKENGCCFASTRVILPSFERQKFQQLLKNMPNSRSWELKYWL
jgi:hypothetical protein